MKIFAIYTNITLIEKPKWLDFFVAKYNPWGLHVTLKQPCHIEDEKVHDLKRRVTHFFSDRAADTRPIRINFDKIETGSEGGDPIIVLAEDNNTITQLQKELCAALSDCANYADPATERYEKNFRPHITISYGIPINDYQESVRMLKDGCRCAGVIDEVVLSVVGSITKEEAENPSNRTVYRL